MAVATLPSTSTACAATPGAVQIVSATVPGGKGGQLHVDAVSYCPGSGDMAVVSTSNPPGTTSRACPGIDSERFSDAGRFHLLRPGRTHDTYQAGTPVEITVTVQALKDRAELASDTKTITPIAS